MIKLKEAVIVEGKYDKMKLSSIIDGVVVDTGGFRIFRDPEKLALIRTLADTRGILILTDSDSAGFLIRNHLKGAIPQDKMKHAYIPDIFGKERRKEKPSKEGKLGVEGVSEETIIRAIRQAGVECEYQDGTVQQAEPITKLDLYECGFSGRDDSKVRRKALLKQLSMPEYLTPNALLPVLNCLMTREEFYDLSKKLKF